MFKRLAPVVVAVFSALAVYAAAAIALYRPYLRWQNHGYPSYILLVPVISCYFLFSERKRILDAPRKRAAAAASALLASGACCLFFPLAGPAAMAPYVVSMVIGGAVLVTAGMFLLVMGKDALRAALFPLAFLAFTIPVPLPALDVIDTLLQHGSSAAVNLIFTIGGIPFVNDGLEFHLPHTSIEIAPQCSGINSSIAFLITAAIAGHLLLSSWWKRAILIALAVPFMLIKNGIRIATLTILAEYVDQRFLTHSWLHHGGGIVFFIAALALMFPFIYWLARSERAPAKRAGP